MVTSIVQLLGSARRIDLAAAMATEDPRRRELAELVPDHVFLNEHAKVLVPVVNLKRMAHELRDDRAGARPGLERLLCTILVQLGNLLVEFLIYIRAFFRAS